MWQRRTRVHIKDDLRHGAMIDVVEDRETRILEMVMDMGLLEQRVYTLQDRGHILRISFGL